MTTFAPVSHDADRHDLSSHALPATNGDVAHSAAADDFTPHQNGVSSTKHTEPPSPSADAQRPEQRSSVAAPVNGLLDTAPVKGSSEAVPHSVAGSEAVTTGHSETDLGSVQPSIETDTSTGLGAPPASAVSVEASNRTDTPLETPVAPKAEPSVLPSRTVSNTPAEQSMRLTDKEEAHEQGTTDSNAQATKTTRGREEDDDMEEPSAKRARTEDAKPAEGSVADVAAAGTSDTNDVAMTDAAPSIPVSAPATTTPVAAVTSPNVPAPASAAVTASTVPLWSPPTVPDFGPTTEFHKKRLLEGMRNLKKSKHANAFSKPVDHVALNLPTYPTIVPNPMDLSTMEQKLRDGEYQSVNAYVDDFNLMVSNAVAFNGQKHLVAQAGQILRSQLQAQLSKLEKAGEPGNAPPKKAVREAPPTIPRETSRRAARPSNHAPAAASPATNQSPVATLDGTPIIRRGSNLDDRPKRKIQKPAPRDLSYAKTPKKRFQGELKFANEVLSHMLLNRYQSISHPFLEPVDPVALGIPHYFKIIKKPMAISNVRDKLSTHQYENLKEFESDVRQIFTNCYKFNPPETAVHQMGKSYEEVFNAEMAKKDERLAIIAPTSAAQSPVGDSDEDEDEDEEDSEEAERMAKLRALNEQVAAIQQQAQELMSGNWGKPKKDNKKGGKGSGAKQRKSGGGSGAAAPARAEKKTSKAKAAPKKQKPLTSSQKQEIAERIGELPTEEINKVADQIKASLRRAGKPVPADDEMEFQIDDIPDELLHELLVKVRKHGPTQPKEQDDDFASPPAPARGGKGKKNKPMSKTEQEAQISRLEGQLKSFGTGESPADAMFGEDAKEEDDDSSEDDSGSESEEE